MREQSETGAWVELAKDTQTAIVDAWRSDRPERFDLAALARALGTALAIGRRLQEAYSPARRPTSALSTPSIDALRAVEALLREVLAVMPYLMQLSRSPSDEVTKSPSAASVARWRSLWASDALHAGLAAAYGRRAASGRERG